MENEVEVEFDSNKVSYYDFEAAKSKCIFNNDRIDASANSVINKPIKE